LASHHHHTTAAPLPQVCFDFTKGRCTRGELCRYSHDPALIAAANSRERGLCFDFLKGVCARGALCRFSHDLSALRIPDEPPTVRRYSVFLPRALHYYSPSLATSARASIPSPRRSASLHLAPPSPHSKQPHPNPPPRRRRRTSAPRAPTPRSATTT
jgi:hypothetical protein